MRDTPRRSRRSTRIDMKMAGTPVTTNRNIIAIEVTENPASNVSAPVHQSEVESLSVSEPEMMETDENEKSDADNVVEMAEIQEVLNKEIENIKASGSKRPKKSSKKASVSTSTNENVTGRSTPSSASRVDSAKNKDRNKNSGSESSQSVQVTWDDPTERMEIQKVAAQLERVCCHTADPLDVCTPTRGHSDLQPPQRDDLEALVRNSILCQHPDYNAAFLANDVVQPQEEYCPPEVVDLRARLDELEKKAKEEKQLRMSLKIKMQEMETRENQSKNLLQTAETRITSQNEQLENLTAEVAEQKKMLENVDKEMAELQVKVQQIQKQLEVMQKQSPSVSR